MAAAMTGGALKRLLSDGGGKGEECNRQIPLEVSRGALWSLAADRNVAFLDLPTSPQGRVGFIKV